MSVPEINNETLAAYLDSNIMWKEVAELYGFENGKTARLAALRAKEQLDGLEVPNRLPAQ